MSIKERMSWEHVCSVSLCGVFIITLQEGPPRVPALHTGTLQLLEPQDKLEKSWACAQWWSSWLTCMSLRSVSGVEVQGDVVLLDT